MPLSAGTRLGPYEILALIGEGGMGQAYRARDTKLNRDVALKVLPEAFARDPERMARFQREAEVLASLNHPNIAAIYGVEQRALVMEFVEGASPKGPLPFEEAWYIASQIAAALEYAHDKGIVHRDLKPANIKVTPEGVIKLLDFGLAKAFTKKEVGPASTGGENSPTLTIGATEAGVILGTPAYMSPEQAKGKPVDKRADIWAFGVVLYELLAGERLFKGEETGDILAAVLKDYPPWDKVPVQARRLLQECLEKDPKQRLRDIGDAKRLWQAELWPAEGLPLRVRGRPVAWITAGALAVTLAICLWLLWPPPAALKPLVRLEVDLGADVSAPGFVGGADVVLSPDGERLVFVSQGLLFTRRLDQSTASELAGTQGASAPFFSPDGQWVGFTSGGRLLKASVAGGTPVSLLTAGRFLGGSWGEDGTIVAALTNPGALSRIPSSGGTPTPVTELAPGEFTHRWPQILPGGKAVLFTASTAPAAFDNANIDVVTLGDRRRKTVVRGGAFGRYLPSGHLVYVNRGTLFAVPFDPDKLETRGSPVPVLDEIAYSASDGYAQIDFAAATGTLVYRRGGASEGGLVTVQWLDRAGKTKPLLAKPDHYLWPRLSPDGQRLAVSTTDVWIYEWQRDTLTRLTFGGASGIPAWTPDGRYIVFRTVGEGMFAARSDGAGKPQLLAPSKGLVASFSFTPDGKRLAFQDTTPENGFDLWTMPIESESAGLRAGKPEPFLQTQFNERHPSFSPDGRWLAYSSDESGAFQIYVRAFPDKGGKWQVSNNGGVYPVFSRDGRNLFFRTEDSRMMVAGYTAKGDSFKADTPRVWSEKRIANIGLNGYNYDVAPDGTRIAVLMPPGEPEARQQAASRVIFLENFFDELRRRAPAGK